MLFIHILYFSSNFSFILQNISFRFLWRRMIFYNFLFAATSSTINTEKVESSSVFRDVDNMTEKSVSTDSKSEGEVHQGNEQVFENGEL